MCSVATTSVEWTWHELNWWSTYRYVMCSTTTIHSNVQGGWLTASQNSQHVWYVAQFVGRCFSFAYCCAEHGAHSVFIRDNEVPGKISFLQWCLQVLDVVLPCHRGQSKSPLHNVCFCLTLFIVVFVRIFNSCCLLRWPLWCPSDTRRGVHSKGHGACHQWWPATKTIYENGDLSLWACCGLRCFPGLTLFSHA